MSVYFFIVLLGRIVFRQPNSRLWSVSTSLYLRTIFYFSILFYVALQGQSQSIYFYVINSIFACLPMVLHNRNKRYISKLQQNRSIHNTKNKTIVLRGKDKAVKIYINAKTKRKEILSDNDGKSGIYLWHNIESGKSYIGQGQNLGNPISGRLLRYYHKSYLNNPKEGVSLIKRAILKYGHHNFIVAILEYCPISILDEREQFWLDELKPEYNILKFARSTRGYKHTLASLIKMRGKRPGFSPSLENRIKIGKAANRIYTQDYRDLVSEREGNKIYAFDLNNKLINSYSSISKLKEAYKIKLQHKTLYKRISEGEIFNNHRFSFSPLGLFNKNNLVISISNEVKRKKIRIINITNPEQSLIFNTLTEVTAFIKKIDGKSDRVSIRKNLKSGTLYKKKWKLEFALNPDTVA